MIESGIAYHILCNLVHNEKYCREVIAHIKPDYFQHKAKKVICEEIIKFHAKYNKPPSVEILAVQIGKRRDVTEDVSKDIDELLETFEEKPDVEYEWLYNQTEEFCKKQEVFNALQTSISIYEDEKKGKSLGEIPDILRNALSVSFDTGIGHEYFEDAEARYDHLHRKEDKLSFNLEMFNRITRGGISKKTLNVVIAGIGVGKTMFMTNFAAHTLRQGKNVVYFTMEMAEEHIGLRIDANLMNSSISNLLEIDKKGFNKKLNEVRERAKGYLTIKEYPTATANCGHLRAFLDELKMKKSISPDLIIVDYLNICIPQRSIGQENLYASAKSVAEELRGLAVEYDVPVLSGVQLNREGFKSSDPGMENAAESFGVPATCDLMFALITKDRLEENNQIMVKQLKNRYHAISSNKSFTIKLDRSRMKFLNSDENVDLNLNLDEDNDDSCLS